MSFSVTWPQILSHTKTVTRRSGWVNLKPGELFQAIKKGQGLRKGEKVKRGPVLRCVSNTIVRLRDIDQADLIREGFPNSSPLLFVKAYCELNRCDWRIEVQRIEFEYVEEP